MKMVLVPSLAAAQDSHNNTYWCVRTLEPQAGGHNWLYCEFEGGFVEFYDIAADPWQRENMAPTTPPSILQQQHQRLAELRTCSGTSCHTRPAPLPDTPVPAATA
jgi:hypothetical protein